MELPKERGTNLEDLSNIDFRTKSEKKRDEKASAILKTYAKLKELYPDQPKSRLYVKVAELEHTCLSTVRNLVMRAEMPIKTDQ